MQRFEKLAYPLLLTILVQVTKKADNSVLPQELTIHKIEPGNGESYFLGLCADLSNQLHRIDDRETGGVDLLTQLPSPERFLEQLDKEYGETKVKSC